MNELSLERLAERVERLEIWNQRLGRQNRLLKLAAIAVLLLFTASLLTFAANKKRVSAERFILRDAQGRMRADLAATELGSGLVLYDAQGEARANLAVTGKGPSLLLYDAHGELRVMLSAGQMGTSLIVWDAKGKARAQLSALARRTYLSLYNLQGKRVWSAP